MITLHVTQTGLDTEPVVRLLALYRAILTDYLETIFWQLMIRVTICA